MSRRSSLTSPPRTGSSSTTLPLAASSSTTPPPPCVRVPRHVARLVTRLVAPPVVNYFDNATRLGASARRAARRAARCAARCRLLRQCRVSGCLKTSCGSSRHSSCRSSSTIPPRAGSSSTTPPCAVSPPTTSPPPHIRVPRHVARFVAWLVAPLVIACFAYATRPGALACHAARRGSSSTTPCVMTSSCGHIGSTSATPCVVTTCLAATLDLLRVRRAPP
jgi:hypothetical protein